MSQQKSIQEHFEKCNVHFSEIDFDASKQVALLDYHVAVNLLPEFKQKLCYDDGSGCFAVGGFEIILKRKVDKYVNNYFIPAGLLVIISWVRNANKNYDLKIYEAILTFSD